jgi:hypothetical protein
VVQVGVDDSVSTEIGRRRLVLRAVRDRYAESPTSGTLLALRGKQPGLVFLVTSLVPLDRLGRVNEMALDAIKPGDITPILTGLGGKLYFLHLLKRERRRPLPFEQIRDRVAGDFRAYQKEEVLESLYGPGSFTRMFHEPLTP